MTEQVNTENFTQSSNAGSSVASNNVANTVTPKTYTEDEVNRIAGSKKQDGYQKGYEAAETKYMQSQQQQNYVPPQNNAPPINHVNQPQQMLTADQARALAQEEVQKVLQTQNTQLVVNNFLQKVNAGGSKIENFDYATVEKELNLPQNPAIWVTASEFENPAEILNELWKNPRQYSELKNLHDSPAMLKRAMQQMADSLKQNAEAEKARVANPPLSRQKPSTVGVDSGKDKSEYSVQDWKQILRK